MVRPIRVSHLRGSGFVAAVIVPMHTNSSTMSRRIMGDSLTAIFDALLAVVLWRRGCIFGWYQGFGGPIILGLRGDQRPLQIGWWRRNVEMSAGLISPLIDGAQPILEPIVGYFG